MSALTDSKDLLRTSPVRGIERRAFLKQGLSLGALTLLTGCDVTDQDSVQTTLNAISRWNDRVQAALFTNRLMPTYPESAAVKDFRFNAYYGEDAVPKIDGANYKLGLSGLIDRRKPLTLDELYALPQVSVAWGTSSRDTYLAMIIHRAPRQGLYDASGRKVVLTYCFCVPFRELAAGAVSYRAMYDAFRQQRLLAADEAGIKVDLPVMSLPDEDRGMPMLAASLRSRTSDPPSPEKKRPPSQEAGRPSADQLAALRTGLRSDPAR